MPRRGFIAKRDVLPDPIYNSKVVTKLINNIMLDGKKSVAQGIVYDAFDIIKEKEGKNPFEITKFDRTNTAGEIKSNYDKFEQKDVTVAGRIIAKRIMGKFNISKLDLYYDDFHALKNIPVKKLEEYQNNA